MDLLELAERCEAATEGQQPGLLWEVGSAVFGEDFAGDSHSGAAWFKHYAQAEAWLDAALTLVPEGMEWELYCYDPRRDPRFGRYQARIPLESMDDDPDETGPQAIANGNSAALALCSAALKARAAEGSAPNE